MKSPFKFLDSYTIEDRSIFFGRDQEITELYRRVFESKILLVYGVSGTGKSSLINCGLASRFDDSDWLPVNVRRGNNIIDSLNDSFNKQAIKPFRKDLSVSEKLQSIYLDHFKPVYLIFDQFEELFILGSVEEKTGFIKLIKEVVESETQCRLIFIIREEFLAGITEFENDLPDIFSNRFRVEKMKRANAITAIEGPCKVFNIAAEPGFSEELIDKLCPARNEIELTYLQIYLDRIFRLTVANIPMEGTERGSGFTIELLSRAGNVSDLLGQFLEEQIGTMDDPNTATSILKSFVSVQGTKKQMSESEIIDSTGAFGLVLSEKELIRYLERFVDIRILRERDDSGHFELRHDALAAKIYEKFTLIEKELLEVRIFIENSFKAFNTRKTYLTGDDLEYLSAYEKRLFLPPILGKFVQDSKDKLHFQQRALRRLTTLVAFIFLIIVGAGVRYYLNNKGNAEAKELTTLALLQEKVDPLTSINTAFKIREKDSVSTVVQGIILNSFYKLLQEKLEKRDTPIPEELLPRSIPVKGKVVSMGMNKTGTHLFGWTDDKEVFTCNIRDSIVHSFNVENEIVTVEISPDAKYLAIVCRNNMGNVYKIDGKELFVFETTVNYLMNNRLVRFFQSGKYFMAAVKDNKAVIYDSTGTDLFDLVGHKGRVNSLDISPDSRFVATASCDKSVLIWNFNHKTNQFSPYDTLIRYKDKFRSYNHPDSIIGPYDTIWSCEFDRKGRYILTASADSLINIWSLNGVLRNEAFIFAMNSTAGIQWFWPLFKGRGITFESTIINKSFIEDNHLSCYYKKVYDATFAADEKAIIASNYSNTLKDRDTNGLFRCQILYYDGRSHLSDDGVSKNSFIFLEQHRSRSSENQAVRFLEITSDRKLLASVSFQESVIQLVASDGYKMLNIPGSFPLFSNDGETLFYINKSTIVNLPVDLKKIQELVLHKRLFGNPESGGVIWKVL